MATIDEYNMVVNGVSLINNWRKTCTGIAKGRDSSHTVKASGIEFVIEASNEAELADRLRVTEAEFNQTNPSVIGFRTEDGTDGANRIVDWNPTDGETVEIRSAVSILPQEPSTRHSYYMYLEVTADISPHEGAGSGPRLSDDIDGIVGNIELIEVWDTGGTKTASVGGMFGTELEDESVGPFTITSIASGGSGKSVLTVSETVENLPANPYATISGSVRYNGQHRITASTAGTITIEKDFVGTDTGVANVGATTTPDEFYDDAEDALLEMLGVGEENSTMTVINTTKNHLGDGTMEFSITAQEQEFIPGGAETGPKISSVSLKVEKLPKQDWPEHADLSAFGGGTAPQLVQAQVLITVDRRKMGSEETLLDIWEASKSDVMARFAGHLDVGVEDLDVSSESVSLDGTLPSIAVVIVAWNDFTGVLSLEYSRATHTPHEAYIFSRGPLHGIQFPETPPIKAMTRTITRIGKTLVDLSSIPAPAEAGYHFHLNDENETESGPDNMADLGGDFYTQGRTEVWLRLKLEETP